ncbi:hypothetical protein [Photobacterium aquimaris]|nr:hypothetical protein [Photobacterium aquimaris]
MRAELLAFVMAVLLVVGGSFSVGELSYGDLKMSNVTLKAEGIAPLLK